MTTEEHKARHEELHRSLDELLADWLNNDATASSKRSVFDLLEWSYGQTRQPSEKP